MSQLRVTQCRIRRHTGCHILTIVLVCALFGTGWHLSKNHVNVETATTLCLDEDGNVYESGMVFNGTGNNWCNTCSCRSDGEIACTKKACVERRCVGDLLWDDCASPCPESCQSTGSLQCILVCQARCACPQGTVQLTEDSSSCVKREKCSECSDDTECSGLFDETKYCRKEKDNEEGTCTEYAGTGQDCGVNQRRCNPLESFCSPSSVDLSGICVSFKKNCNFTINGTMITEYYNIGDDFTSDCNTCKCQDSGTVNCTKNTCF